MILSREEGIVVKDPASAKGLVDAGYHECYGKLRNGALCNFFLSPQTVEYVREHGGYYTCPICQHSFDLMQDVPWHGVQEENWNPSESFRPQGGTRIGIPMADQGQIGEDIVKNLGELPGYGPITWWHQGNAQSSSPLDGATADWGIEVKTLSYDATHHRFMAGGVRNGYDEKAAKNEMAEKMGLKGILGILVLLDYRRSVADIYAKEMPLAPWPNAAGKLQQGIVSFRSNTAQHLIAEVPFKNPLMTPDSPVPVGPVDRSGVEMAF